MNLAQVKKNKQVLVREILSGSLRVKLLEMGLIKGKSLKMLYTAPLGDPIAVDIGGYVLSLRKDEACMVQVDLVE